MLKLNLDLTDQLSRTLDWNLIGAGGVFDFSDQRKSLQHNLVIEEGKELHHAVTTNDVVEVVDAICDILFVAYYAWFLSEGGILQTMDLKVDGELPFLDLDYTIFDLDYQIHQLINAHDYSGIVRLILKTQVIFNFDLVGAYTEVCDSNFSKFPVLESFGDLQNEIEHFEKSKYEDVVSDKFGEYSVFRCDNGKGKIVKPSGYFEPKLKQFIGE